MPAAKRVSVQGRALALSNLEKVLYPAAGFRKANVLDYYRRVATWLLPHLRQRALTLKRYPDGVEGEFFYEKRCPAHRPDWVNIAQAPRDTGDPIGYCEVNDLPALMWIANLASLELHPLLCRSMALDRPTAVVFDLDPGPPAKLLDAARIAVMLRDALEGIGLRAVAKVSGKEGVHVYVPVNTPITFEQSKGFARTVAETLEKHHGDLVTSAVRKDRRQGKVFIDWSQNDAHKTTVCPYSLRATPEPRVAAPVDWKEIERAIKSRKPSALVFSPEEVIRRAEEHGDLLEPLLTLRQRLPGVEPPTIKDPAVWTSAGHDGAGTAAKGTSKRRGSKGEPLAEYRRRRRFTQTPEPAGGEVAAKKSGARFVVQRHAARALHHDFRLEHHGVLLSWAVPKGPSLDPAHKRLAVRTEDHPLEYVDFEGAIPKGDYGGGEVIIWDRGTYRSFDEGQPVDLAAGLEKGHLDVWLEGVKLHGGFTLIRTRPAANGREQWLLMKRKDDAADPRSDPVRTEPQSVLSGLWAEDLEAAATAPAPRGGGKRKTEKGKQPVA